MKILQVVTAVHKNGGGTSEVVPRMCDALALAGHEVRLVTGVSAAYADSVALAVKAGVDFRPSPIHLVKGLGFWRLTKVFRETIREGVEWADVVHVHGLWQDPCWYAAWMARKYAKPYIIQPHGFLEPARLKISRLQKKFVGRLIERPNLNHAVTIVATAESEREGILRYGVKPEVVVIPLGLDTDKIDGALRDPKIVERWGFSAEKKTLLYFSRLTPIKGLDMLAEAWRRVNKHHDDWQLLMVGPDDRGYSKIVKGFFADDIANGNVVVAGPVFGDDKFRLLKSVDAFVLPTRSENWSIAVQEAMAAGLPVVCTKGAPWQVLEEGAGKWVDISSEAIADGLNAILSASDEERQNMGRCGMTIVARDFKWTAVAKKMEDMYKCAIG